MQRRVLLALGIVCCLSAVAQAALSINVGAHTYPFGSTGLQVIPIYVSGGDPVQGINLNMAIADGGPDFGGPLGPGMASVVSSGAGTVFGTNVNPPSLNGPIGSTNQLWQTSFTVAVGTTSADSLLNTLPLALVTIDLTGLTALSPGDLGAGSWTFNLGGALAGSFPTTDFGNTEVLVTNGSITILPEVIVPEPSSIVLGLFAAAGLGAVALRKRRMA
jgi:hypothetical protein